MELRTFIRTALIDIIGAVEDVQKEMTNGCIVPKAHSSAPFVEMGVTPYQAIEFEVSVTTEESKGSEGKLGVVSAFVGAGVAGKSSRETAQASVLRFRVPIRFPLQEETVGTSPDAAGGRSS